MATFADLTTEQKDTVQQLATFAKTTAGEFAKLLNAFRAITSGYSGNVETLLATITLGTETIPKIDDLAGSQSLTKNELTTLIGYFIVASATPDNSSGSYNTAFHRSLYAKAAGPVNTI